MSETERSDASMEPQASPWVEYLLNRLSDWKQIRHELGAESLPEEEGELYHYTTAEGLKGIVESNCIWASDATYLNDASEINYGCAVLDEVLDEWEKANKRNQSLATSILEALRSRFGDKSAPPRSGTDFYVACFCEKGNLLSQWRAYGQSGGYSIGFNIVSRGFGSIGSPKLVALNAENANYDARLLRVIYDPRRQRERLHALLRNTLPVLDDREILKILSRSTRMERKGYQTLAMLLIEDFVLEEIIGFKNRAFAEEHEWRIVVRRKDHYIYAPSPKGAVHLRSARGLMVPFVKVIPSSGKLPIKSVTFGPSLDKSRAEGSLRMLCGIHGFGGVRIRGSEIPVLL